jgi:hypothetical protein
MVTASVLSLILPAAAAVLVANRIVTEKSAAARIVTWFISFAAAVIIPIHLAAALQLLGVTARVPLILPALGSALIIACLTLVRRPPRQLSPEATELRTMDAALSPKGVGLAAVVIGGTYAMLAVDRLTSFPSSWDGVAYHLPLALHWLHEGSLAIDETSSWRRSLPANAEIVAMLVLGTGWQAFTEVWNVVSALALCAGSYLLARGVGVGHPAAFTGAVVVASIPIVLFQAFSAYVDLFGSAGVVGALGLFVASLPSGAGRPSPRWTLTISGLGCGLAAGTKPTLWPAAALAAAGMLTWVFRQRRVPDGRAALALWFGVATAAPCVFWFVRNLAITGNPFYPLGVHIEGLPLLIGLRPSDITSPDHYLHFVRSPGEWLVYPWIEFKRAGYNVGTGSGLGPLFAALVPAGMLYWLCTLPDRPVDSARTTWLAGAGGLVAGTAVWWFTGHATLRFALPMVVLACVLATPFIDDALRARPRVTSTLLVTAALGAALLSALPPAHALLSRVRHGSWDRHQIYEVPELIDTLAPCSIVINHNPIDEFWNSFALAGRRLTNRVVPPWEANRALDRPPDRRCPTYVFDHRPFMSPEETARLTARGYVLLDLPPLDTTWRVWKSAAAD